LDPIIEKLEQKLSEVLNSRDIVQIGLCMTMSTKFVVDFPQFCQAFY
jgi:hypothetical protein